MKLLFSSILLFFSFSCFAQSSSVKFEKDIDFLFYLGENGQHADIDFYGEKLLKQDSLNEKQKDSLNFVMGLINFNWLNYNKSLHFLSQISDKSIFHPKSSFYSELCYIKNHDYSTAFNYLKHTKLDTTNDLLQQLKSFELAGLSLLKRDYNSFETLDGTINTTNDILKNEHQLLQKNYNVLKNLKRKSPVLAGTLSAVIPGLGLAYAGNNGQALATFIRVVALGALTSETFAKLGPKNPQFIASACLFSFFYMGNIWGSVLSVQIVKNEKLKEIDNNIMVGLSVPIDKFFK